LRYCSDKSVSSNSPVEMRRSLAFSSSRCSSGNLHSLRSLSPLLFLSTQTKTYNLDKFNLPIYISSRSWATESETKSPTSPTPKRTLRTFTRAEVAKHVHEDDCWIIINNKVYNISTWADIHPGGKDVLYQFAGGDGTDLWAEVGHTLRARQLMERYCIGKVAEPRRYVGFHPEPQVLDEETWEKGITPPNPEDMPPEVFEEDVSAFRKSTNN
jgi:cytochrome b involved in lipid metabolism